MNSIKKIIPWLVILLTLAVALSLFINERMRIKKMAIEEEKRQKKILEELEKDTFRTEGEIYERLIEAMESGESDSVYMRVPGTFTLDELKDIAYKVDPMFGRVYKMSYQDTKAYTKDEDGIVRFYIGVKFEYEVCDEYYVLEKIIHSKPIPENKKEALELCSVCEAFMRDYITSDMSEYDKELTVHDYIVSNCEYSFSDKNDMSEYYAYGALVNQKAVCSGYSRATALLLTLCDIDVKLLSGDAYDNMGVATETDSTNESESVIAPDGTVVDGHMWNQVKIEGQWYHLDTTWDDPYGTDEPKLNHDFFNVNDSILKKNHEWESKDAEPCSSTLQNYYEKNGIFFRNNSSYTEYVKEYLSAGNRDKLECAVSYPDTSEEELAFIFTYDGITSYQVGIRGVDGYEIITLYFNPE